MKPTGIVRRLDELGRIVIPKEIRRTFRIKESDPMEIFTGKDGEIILKKYSPIGEMGLFAKQYAESLSQVSAHTALIADRDVYIAVTGSIKGAIGKSIGKELEDHMNKREVVLAHKGERSFIPMWEDMPEEVQGIVAAPIIAAGDVVGVVCLISNNPKERMGDVEKKLIQAGAGFLGKQLEQ
ncbi:MAG: stage V sporulation T C-terminal domain-containing protein [Lachnospiraceae bacterium]